MGRFPGRPYWPAAELEALCECHVTQVLQRRYGACRYPISTDDLTVLIEETGAVLDPFADLDHEGPDVDGVTIFRPAAPPLVQIAARLATDRFEHRYRSTLTHELGHVLLHAELHAQRYATGTLFTATEEPQAVCRQQRVLTAPAADWLEWQAGYVSGACLMPEAAVRELLRQERTWVGVLPCGHPRAAPLLQQVAHTFQVSQDAARVRVLQLRLLSEGAEEQLPLWA